jgi:2-polyprenyl-3-methyl-5-hydroxy-6-metoxy-1,4-benzoquinol methylase
MSVRARLRAAAERLVRNLPPARRLRTELASRALAGEGAGRELSVLDAGCEQGALTLHLAGRHPRWRITAVDINDEALAIARRRGEEHGARNVTFKRVDLTRDRPDGAYDAVAAMECLSEIPDDGAALAYMAGALRPGGLLVLHVPEHGWRPVLRGSPATWRTEVRHGYSADELAAKLRATGLEVVSVSPTTHAAVHLGEELRERVKQRSLKAQLAVYPLAALVVALERAGWRPGRARALLALARRPLR